MLSRRQHARVRSFMLAKITDPAGSGEWLCTVNDLSPTGAQLLFTKLAPRLKGEITIEIAATREARQAQIAWRKEQTIGISFAARAGTPNSPSRKEGAS